jgi:hypothetical protein
MFTERLDGDVSSPLQFNVGFIVHLDEARGWAYPKPAQQRTITHAASRLL